MKKKTLCGENLLLLSMVMISRARFLDLSLSTRRPVGEGHFLVWGVAQYKGESFQ